MLKKSAGYLIVGIVCFGLGYVVRPQKKADTPSVGSRREIQDRPIRPLPAEPQETELFRADESSEQTGLAFKMRNYDPALYKKIEQENRQLLMADMISHIGSTSPADAAALIENTSDPKLRKLLTENTAQIARTDPAFPKKFTESELYN